MARSLLTQSRGIRAVAIVGTLCLLGTPAAIAQRGSQTIMRGNPDGTHEVLMLTAPDYTALRTPDITIKDLPLMTRTLSLSDEQANVIQQIIEQYLDEFRTLTKRFAETTKDPEAEFSPDKKERGEAAAPDENDPSRLLNMNMDEFDLPPGVNASIGTSMSSSRSDDPNVPAPPPMVKVSVTLDSPEGDDIPEELIEQIRQRANEVAANLAEYMMAQEAARQAGARTAKPEFASAESFEVLLASHEALMQNVENFIKAKAKLREHWVINSQVILSTEQIERWPAFERALYRERSLSKGQLPGESIDVITLLDKLELNDDQMQAIAADLEPFELALDSALRQRDALLATATQRIDEAIANKQADLALSLTDRVTSARVAVRTLNQNAVEQFAQALETEAGESLRAAALKRAYPSVYTETRGRKMFNTVKALDNLDEQSRQAIASAQTAYESELSSVNQQLRAAIDRDAISGARRGIEHLKDSMQGKPSKAMEYQDPIRPLLIKRAELDDQYGKLLSDVLGPDRAAALPKPRKNRDPIRIDSDSSS